MGLIGYFARTALVIFATLLGGVGLVTALDFPSSHVLTYAERLRDDDFLRELRGIDIDRGINYRLLAFPPAAMNVQWSPNGRQIAFSVGNGFIQDLRIWNLDSRRMSHYNLALLPDEADTLARFSLTGYSWSPDSRQIAYSVTGSNITALNILDTGDGSSHSLIAATNGMGTFSSPLWSPRGDQIAYDRISDISNIELCIVFVDGVGEHCVGFTGSSAHWSSDGQFLVFAGRRRYEGDQLFIFDTGNDEIKTIDFDGTLPVIGLMNPRWSPDGTSIAIEVRYGSGDSELQVISPDGVVLYRHDNPRTSEVSTAWSYDGEMLGFITAAPGASDEVMVDYLSTPDEPRLIAQIQPPVSSFADTFQPTWWPPIQ